MRGKGLFLNFVRGGEEKPVFFQTTVQHQKKKREVELLIDALTLARSTVFFPGMPGSSVA